MEIITINNKQFILKTENLYLGRKKINKEIATKNLLDFKDVMDKYELDFLLGYGTLLGAFREKDFISHDEDIDILMLDKDKIKFFNILKELEKIDFIFCRYDERGLVSIMRNQEYIDIYFFHEYKDNIYKCAGEFIQKNFLYERTKIKFLNTEFEVPFNSKKILEFWYGKDWKIPIDYAEKKNNKISKIIAKSKLGIKKYLPDKIKKLIYFTLEKKNEKNFLKRIKRNQ